MTGAGSLSRPRTVAALPGFAAWVFAPMLRRELPAVMRSLSAGGADPGYLKELQVTLDGVDELARLWAAWRASVDGRSEVAPAETVAPSVYEVTTGEAAGILGVSPRRVVQLLHEGALSGRRVGRTWLVDRASVVLRRGW